MAKYERACFLAAILALGTGCSAVNLADLGFSPTHRWARADTAVAQYNFHNVRCVEESKVDLGEAYRSSTEFLAYRDCMERQGFELMALAPTSAH